MWFVDGVFDRELHAVTATINVDKLPIVKWKDLHAYLSRWQWPNQFAGGAKVFETGGFQATASQTMTSAPVLAFCFRK